MTGDEDLSWQTLGKFENGTAAASWTDSNSQDLIGDSWDTFFSFLAASGIAGDWTGNEADEKTRIIV